MDLRDLMSVSESLSDVLGGLRGLQWVSGVLLGITGDLWSVSGGPGGLRRLSGGLKG